jgi:hypothetical protein
VVAGSRPDSIWNLSCDSLRSGASSLGDAEGAVVGWLELLGTRLLSDGNGMRKNLGDAGGGVMVVVVEL